MKYDLIIRLYNPIKNSFQFIMGSVLYFSVFNVFDPARFVFGLLGFVIAYQSVYQYNDLMDYKEDVKDEIRKRNKPLARSEFTREYVESFSYILTIVGMSLCFLVNVYFGLLVAFTLFLNFLHSVPFLRLKNTKLVVPNLFVIEFLKYSLGWFALSITLNNFPYVFMSFLSLLYVGCYIFWKNDIRKNVFQNMTLKIIFTGVVMLYLISLVIYTFKLPLIIPIPISIINMVIIFNWVNLNDVFEKIRVSNILIYMMMFTIVISMVLLSDPVVAELNDGIAARIDTVKENITNTIPNGIKNDIESLDERITENMCKVKEHEIKDLIS